MITNHQIENLKAAIKGEIDIADFASKDEACGVVGEILVGILVEGWGLQTPSILAKLAVKLATDLNIDPATLAQ